MARSSMAALIARVRLLMNDPAGASQQFSDDDIQGVLDEGRQDMVNVALIPTPTYASSTIQYLNYYSDLGGWEDDYVLKQYLTVTVSPASVEPIAGHFQFASTTFPPVYITGKLHDIYRAAADLLQRWSARWALSYTFSSDGQSFQRSQAAQALQNLAREYRLQQRPRMLKITRSDLADNQNGNQILGPTAIDYMGKG